MSRICEYFNIGKNGECENYIKNNNKRKTSCSYSCKVYKTKGNKNSKLRKTLDKQIVGLYVPYETGELREKRK